MNKDRNALQLAYIGDAIYEIYIREYFINKNIVKVNDLQKEAIKYVCAKGQSSFLKEMLDNNFFDQTELEVIYRARNHSCAHKPKNTDIRTYKYATSLEAVIGYLYLEKNYDRIKQIMDTIIDIKETK